jgi:hypothetical protein
VAVEAAQGMIISQVFLAALAALGLSSFATPAPFNISLAAQ